jgi:hypothetical protein
MTRSKAYNTIDYMLSNSRYAVIKDRVLETIFNMYDARTRVDSSYTFLDCIKVAKYFVNTGILKL